MTGSELAFEREIDLPPGIVWDALVDPVLLEGWLGSVSLDPVAGGSVEIDWLDGSGPTPTLGTVSAVEPPHLLTIATDNRGTVAFRLTEQEGGTRGSSTALQLRVLVDVEMAFTRPLSASWGLVLDRLESLLRGHPIDWAVWRADQAEGATRVRKHDGVR